MAIKTYHAGSNEKVSKNFVASEFGCCNADLQLDDKLVGWLQKIRDHFGKPVNISSGYRCPEHNAQAGGSPKSYHMKGMAADIYIMDYLHNPKIIAQYAEQIGVTGIGLYENSNGQYFVHIDTRPNKCYWYSHKEIVVSTFQDEPKPQKPDTMVKVEVRVLKKGCTGDDVRSLQMLLNGHGYKLDIDGSFGVATDTALKAYQKDNGLIPDGSCGPATWTSLIGK